MTESHFRPALELALQSALEHLAQLENIPADEVLKDLVQDTHGGILPRSMRADPLRLCWNK